MVSLKVQNPLLPPPLEDLSLLLKLQRTYHSPHFTALLLYCIPQPTPYPHLFFHSTLHSNGATPVGFIYTLRCLGFLEYDSNVFELWTFAHSLMHGIPWLVSFPSPSQADPLTTTMQLWVFSHRPPCNSGWEVFYGKHAIELVSSNS